MKRFFGMMPSDEVKLEAYYKSGLGYKIIVQVGEHGWSIIYADGSSDWKDEVGTVEENFIKARDTLMKSTEATLIGRKFY